MNGVTTGITTNVYTPTQNGVYTVVASGVAGCTLTSAPYDLTNLSLLQKESVALFEVWPTVSEGIFNLRLLYDGKNSFLTVRDVSGKQIFHQENLSKVDVLDLSGVDGGVYFLEVISEGSRYCRKVVVR